ncbi:BnaC08g15520D [Brassica napus]|uniref:BnaC08g15520D protein n=1 Tax=Brassica napus TaxID=3708 RepID=A0A078H178_BRANA|nr:BnaC08g15520D [Brassica napus]
MSGFVTSCREYPKSSL